jgi:hypothetical protein
LLLISHAFIQLSSTSVPRVGKFCIKVLRWGSRNVPRHSRLHSARRARSISGVILRSGFPNGSLGLFRKNNAQHKHCWHSASASAPIRRGSILRSSTGRPSRPPLFYFGTVATVPLTNGESISTLFRVGKRLHLPGCGVVGLWLIPSADR